MSLERERRAGLVNRVRRDLANFEFHLAGQHEQKSHGNWADGSSVDFRETFGGAFDPHGLMDKNPKIGRAGSMALDTIASIHGIEKDWPQVLSMVDNGEWLGADEGSLGAYMPPEPDPDPEVSLDRGRVVMRGTDDVGQMASTLVHELGHHLTLARGVEAFAAEREREGPLRDLMTAINETGTARDLENINNNMQTALNKLAPHEGDKRGQIMDQQGFVSYLQMPEEMFARAYAQYIAVKSKNTAMLTDIVKVLNDENTGGIMQWPPSEFDPLVPLFDEYLRSRGLLKE